MYTDYKKLDFVLTKGGGSAINQVGDVGDVVYYAVIELIDKTRIHMTFIKTKVT